MEKKKLLYIGNKLSKKGSTVTSIETLGTFLKAEGFQVAMASSQKNKGLRMLDMLWAVVKHSKKNTCVLIDTYSTQNFYYAVLVAKLCSWYKLPYIPILRGGNLPVRLDKSPKLCANLFNKCFTNIAPSQYLMDAFSERGFTKLLYIPNTIAIDNYVFKLRKKPRARLLWVRSFSEIYNPLLAISVVKELQQQGVDVTLTMVGPQKDASFEACKSQVDTENLPITFTGKLEKEQWIQLSEDFDIFINTTNFDNTPVSVIEAMALGLPVVSTNVGGLPNLIESEVDGLLIPPNNIQDFVNAIKTLIENPENSQKIAVSAREKVEQFDWNVVKQQWISLLSH